MTCALFAGMSSLFFYMWNYRIGLDAVSLTFNRVFRERHYYRLVSAAVTHVDMMHILFNMGSLLQMAPLEAWLGSLWYAETTLLLLYSSMALWMLIVYLATTRYGYTAWADSPVVGYSGVLFGWMTVAGMLNPSASIFGFPVTLTPFFSLLLMQLIVARASFLGHLAGILAGYAVGWGLLNGARGYWLWVITLGAAGACLLSLRTTAALGPCLDRYITVSPSILEQLEYSVTGEEGAPQRMEARMVGGVLSQWRVRGRQELAGGGGGAAAPPPAAGAAAAAGSAPFPAAAAAAVSGAAAPTLALPLAAQGPPAQPSQSPQRRGGAAAAESERSAFSTTSNHEEEEPNASLLSRNV